MSQRRFNGLLTITLAISFAACLNPARVSGQAVGPVRELWQDDSGYLTTSSNLGSGWGDNRWLGSAGNAREWDLGIEGTNTTTGVLVTQVRPNSTAARAGINPQDMVVNVAGTQVGRVGGRIFDLTEQLNRNASSGGSVDLLVYDARSMRLRSSRIQLDNRQGGLTGTLIVSDGRLPRDAVVTLQLENITRPHYTVRNGEYSFRLPTYSNGTIPFSLNFDPAYILPSDTYRLRAFVTSAGRTIYDTREPQYVLTRGNPSTVRIRLTPSAYLAVGGQGDYSGGVITAGYPNYDVISQRVSENYQRYLGRRPSAVEIAAWHQIPDVQFRLSRLPLELMASQEYFDMVGNNNSVWIRKTFGEVIGRTPSALEFDQWMRRFADLRYSRLEVLNQMKSISNGA